jgi:hypothetical protein
MSHSSQQKLIASGRDCASLKFVVLYLSLSRWTGRRFLFARLPQAKRWAILRVRISEIAFYKVLFSLFIYKVAEGTLEERR